MDRLSHLLPKTLRKHGLQKHAESALVVLRADKWLGERFPLIKEHLRVRHFKEGELIIEGSHAVAMQECHASIADLHEYLKIECPFARVRGIRMVRD